MHLTPPIIGLETYFFPPFFYAVLSVNTKYDVPTPEKDALGTLLCRLYTLIV